MLKKYIDARRKDYLEFIKASVNNQAPGIVSTTVDIKQTVTRVTIEGEHTCMLVIRRTEVSG